MSLSLAPTTITTVHLIAGAIGLLLGLLLGWLIWGRGVKRYREASAQLARAQAEIEESRAERARMERELASARDQIRPLSDEVDRLRREQRRRAEPVAPVAPTAAPVEAVPVETAPAPAINEKLPTFLDAPRGQPDDLRMLKGVGDRLQAKFNSIGVFHFHQIANWTPEEVRLVDAKLDQFRGRIERDQLIEQAKLLAAGRITEYEARFGKLGMPQG